MADKKQQRKCVWQVHGKCSGKIKMVQLFSNRVKIPVCEDHTEQHEHIMVLHKNGYDLDKILNESPEYRKGEVLTLQLSGLDEDNTDS